MKTEQIIAVVIVVLGLGYCTQCTPDSTEDSTSVTISKEELPSLAEYCAQDEVKKLLKAPSTAEFNTPATIVPWDDTTFAITGTVDSQNSFGAVLRNTYRCVVTMKNGGDNYSIRNLTLSEN